MGFVLVCVCVSVQANITVMVGIRMIPIDPEVFMFGSQLVDCLGRIRRCGLVGGSVSLGMGFGV